MRRCVAVLALMGALAACGQAAQVDTQRVSALKAGRIPPPRAAGSPGALLSPPSSEPVSSNYDVSKAIHLEDVCDFNGITLSQDVGMARRGAAIVSVEAVGPVLWNTASGARPTRADAAAAHPYQLGLYTAFLVRVQRVLAPYPGLAAGATLTGYLRGGKLGLDSEANDCVSSPIPQAGQSAVAFFLGEFPGQSMAGPLQRPVLGELDLVRGTQAITVSGPQPLPTPR